MFNPRVGEAFGKQSISFHGANNQNSDLFLMPSCRSRQRYEAELLKKESIVDQMLQSIAKNADCLVDEVAECIMNVLFAKFENVFADLEIKRI